ncbi:coiled-coil domain-containing protein 33-like isoform X2 [Dendronephthya gigantea]|uniref:coiled-coil domain-containing protein 33-like isoform X2 n=1 Tax=Dendronephthya gigantea TaxID=151771 RepID=UPI00106B506C|nr:coiled-coil domain-containing protein 33-like isoform X2 [Dendronephthya gigantea]
MLAFDNDEELLKGALCLDLKVHHVLFNQKGKYKIKFKISSSRGDLRQVKLLLNDFKESIFEYEYTTELCLQDGYDTPCPFDDTQFRFEMPKEFSEGEVNLLFEAYQFSDNPLENPFKCGEGKFLVFPCAGPLKNDQPSTSKDKDICYNYTTQIALNKLLNEEQLYVNIGHAQITVLLKIDEEKAPPRNQSLSAKTMVNDAALPGDVEGPSTRHLCGSYLNEVGVYEVVIHVHSACDVVSNTQGRPPQPYVTSKLSNSDDINSSTHATLHPTYTPLWDELLVLKAPKDKISNGDLIINIIDHPKKTLITGYCLPLGPLKPFYPYHLELEQGGKEIKTKLFITLMLKADELVLSSLQSEVYGLEVVLRHFTSSGLTDPLIAALRIVPDSSQYRQNFAEGKQRESYVKTRKVRFPSTDLVSLLKTFYDENQYNVPQVTFSGAPVEQPKWNQMLFFYGDGRWLFNSTSALVIEYYNALQVVNFGRWQPRSPVAYSMIDLNESLLSVLKQQNATMGLCVENITINESTFRDNSVSLANVNVILRLITSKRPDPMLSSTHFHILPVIDASSQQTTAVQRTQVAVNPAPLPMINKHSSANHDVAVQQVSQGQPKTGVDPMSFSVMEHQAKELEKHRFAMKKMADDILRLKSEATRLQATNSRLRLQIDHGNESRQTVPLPLQLEKTTHAELVQRIVIIKGSLDEQIAINRELKLEIQSLQNQLIKKNEREKELYKLQDAHKNQQMLLQKMQERLRRTKTLEDTCKRQEKVILRLEDFLAISKGKGKKNEDQPLKTTEETLLDENKRLRALVLDYEIISFGREQVRRWRKT